MATAEVVEEKVDVRGFVTECALLLTATLQELIPPKSFNVYKPWAKVPPPWPGYKFFAWEDLDELHRKLPKKLRIKLFEMARAWVATHDHGYNVHNPWVDKSITVLLVPLANSWDSSRGYSDAIHGYDEGSHYGALSKGAVAEARRLQRVHPEVYQEARRAVLRMAFERRPTRANWLRLGKEIGWA
jgi:hypothetical protein